MHPEILATRYVKLGAKTLTYYVPICLFART